MRQATKNDFDIIYSIYMDQAVNPFMGYGIMEKENFRAIYHDLLSRDHFWLFQYEGQDCGMCSVVFGKGRESHVAKILSLGIKTGFQGKGLGKKIMMQVLDFLKHKRVKRIELTVESDNDRAIPFYKSLGFAIDGICPNAFIREGSDKGIDQMIMSIIHSD